MSEEATREVLGGPFGAFEFGELACGGWCVWEGDDMIAHGLRSRAMAINFIEWQL